MKDTILILIILGLLGATIFQAEYKHPADLAALRVTYQADLDRLDKNLDDSLAERDHLEEQLAKAQEDLRALADALTEARAAQPQPQPTTAPQLVPAPQPQPAAASAPAPMPQPAPAPDPNRAAYRAKLEADLAALRDRRDYVATYDPNFAEQRIDKNTGRKSGIRTSDADRQKFEAQRRAELQRLDQLITDTQRALEAAK